MAEHTTGWLASDGKFFKLKLQAELYEAEQQLTSAAEELGINPMHYIAVLGKLSVPTLDYLTKRQEVYDQENANVTSTKEDTAEEEVVREDDNFYINPADD